MHDRDKVVKEEHHYHGDSKSGRGWGLGLLLAALLAVILWSAGAFDGNNGGDNNIDINTPSPTESSESTL